MCYIDMMDNKEHLLHFFIQGKINLSQYDQKFLSNLEYMVHRDNRITTNQVALFDKLVGKYSRQFARNGLDINVVAQLPWKATIAESSEKYTSARVSLVDDTLVLRVPFNKEFIAKFREIRHNPFVWDRDNKYYAAPFSTYGLKVLRKNLHKYFPTTVYCEQLAPLVEQINTYKSEIWNPTLANINGNFVILAINPTLGELLKDVELNDDVSTLFKLSKMGINVDESLIVDDRTKFAAEFITEVDIDNMPKTIEWMKELGIERVTFTRSSPLSSSVKKDVTFMMRNAGLVYTTVPSYWSTNKSDSVKPVYIQFHTSKKYYAEHGSSEISKYIVVKNSRPIEIK